jgi:phosphoribosylanthranilate isomerase
MPVENVQNNAKIKICGIMTAADVDAINVYKPDYCGFVFAQKSRRAITAIEAMQLKRHLSDDVVAVGVFVGMSVNDIAVLYDYGIIDVAQLHGGEDDEFITSLKMKCGVPIIQVLRAGCADTPSNFADYRLFDGKHGGSGETFDWNYIPDTGKPWFLAGGINEKNVAEALSLQPFGVDISSGAETDGKKDPEKIRRLIQMVRTYKRAPTI